ncbi:helix-turn-helix domain-containing protein [Saccharopolyspora spinosa]|uniref:helix-turn-helix domain-containing protein n=1 Tax=Saccharopolyspora spinosa TaxID=60894 RepID=UPI00307A6A91
MAALLYPLPRNLLHRLRLLVRPDTVLRWHRDLVTRRHATLSKPKRPGRPRIVRSIRALMLRLAKDNPSWGYRRIHGELLVLEVKVAASTVWEIVQAAGIDPAPDRNSSTWADFLRPRPTPCRPVTSSKPSPYPVQGCTSSPSSNTPPGGSGSWAPPHTRRPRGSPKPHRISSWTSKTQTTGRDS